MSQRDATELAKNALKSSGLDPNNLSSYADKPNEFFSKIQNKVINQYILETLNWENPYTKYFQRPASPVGDGQEILMVNPIEPKDYDASKFIPTINDKPDNVLEPQIIYTTDKKLFMFQMNSDILTAAFSSLEKLGTFIAEYTRQLSQGIEIWLWEVISSDLTNIKNSIVIPKSRSTKGIYKQIYITSGKMANPSKSFNIDSKSEKMNATPKNRQLFITTPEVDAEFKIELFAPLYNISSLTPQENFAAVLVTTNLNADDYAYLIDSDGYFINTRIDKSLSQSFAVNNTTVFAHHLWVRRGLLEKANGVKFQISKT